MTVAKPMLLETSGMTPIKPMDCLIVLQLCTVMNWEPKIPLHIMRDEGAGRWFLKGKPGAQDFWIRDHDIEILMKTPMWPAVVKAKPYGLDDEMPPDGWEKIKPSTDHWRKIKGATTATEIEARMAEGHRRLQELAKKFPDVDKDDALDMYTALAKAAREKGAPFTLTGLDPGEFLIDDPVEEEKQRLAKMRLEAEERIRKMDEWDDS